MQNEESFRRPDFQGGRPVQLADGQSWYIPLPILESRPLLLESRDDRVEALTTFGPEFDRLVAACQETETAPEEARVLLELAVDLLGRNYDLSLDQYRALLQYGVQDRDHNEPLLAIHRIATGTGPRTFARWCRLGAILAGADPDRLPLEDAYELATIQVAIGRHVPAAKWVEELVAGELQQSLDALGAC